MQEINLLLLSMFGSYLHILTTGPPESWVHEKTTERLHNQTSKIAFDLGVKNVKFSSHSIPTKTQFLVPGFGECVATWY